MMYNQFKEYIVLKYNIPPNNKNIKKLYDWCKEGSEKEKKDVLDFLYSFKPVIFSNKKVAERYITKKRITTEDYFLFGYVRNYFLAFIRKRWVEEKKDLMKREFLLKELSFNKEDFCKVFSDFINLITSYNDRMRVIDFKPASRDEDLLRNYVIKKIGVVLKDKNCIGVKFDPNNEYIFKILNECNKVEIVDIKQKDKDIWIFFKLKSFKK